MKELEQFGVVAGLKINTKKTKLMTKNLTGKQNLELEEAMGLQVLKKVKYLGIWLTAHCKTPKENNYDKLMQQVKKDLETWVKLQLSLLGRIATIKMNILPKFLYIFQMIPIKVHRKFFEEFNKIIAKFIWQGKKPRINLKAMQDMKSRGGRHSQIGSCTTTSVASLVWLKEWVNLTNRRILVLEGHNLQRGWHAFLWDIGKTNQKYGHRQLIKDSLLTN
uniref:Reverse transcriptase domain-containing protein n=1 Tax=Micrurus lemniscatus lemniscatus TaxID=129467 RepID=A0A2D4HEM4_MICLE